MEKKKIARKKIAVKKPAPKKTSGKATTLKQPIELTEYLDRVKDRAYQKYLERGSVHGSDFQDWLDAEREVKKEFGIK